MSATTRNDTGQRRDSTGLLYYHARYYDPAIGRFVSANSIVPGSGPLTTAPHDATARAAWAGGGAGPVSPQDLNRYSYAANNPVRNTDPTGHCVGPLVLVCVAAGGAAAAEVAGVVITAIGGALLIAGAAVAGAELGKAQRMAEDTAGDASGAPIPGDPTNSGESQRKVHSRYGDGTPVYEGEQPERLPHKPNGDPLPDHDGAHTQVRHDDRNGRVYQEREWAEGGIPLRDRDYTVPVIRNGRLAPGHTYPHEHKWRERTGSNPGSKYKRGGPE